MTHNKKKLLIAALAQRGAHSRILFILRWLYTIKLLICILLDRENDVAPREDLVKGLLHVDKQRVLWHPDPSVHFWIEYSVGRGLFKNWYFDAYPESTPEGDLEGEINESDKNGNVQGLR